MARRICNPTGKRKVLAPVHPNAGIEAAYRRKIECLIDAMHKSVVYWLRSAYRANPPANSMAADISPAKILNAAMRRLARRWQKNFDEAAPKLADYFATNARDRSAVTLRSILKKAGIAVEFKHTEKTNDAVQAVIAENVGLIRSIAQEHLSDIQGLVMRSVAPAAI